MTKRVLVIGVGSIGERHLRCFGLTGRCEMWVCETNDSLRRRIVKQYDVGKQAAKLDAFLQDPPDVAVICTPAPLHIPMATQLAESGVDLLIEKPLGMNTEGVGALRSIIQRRDLAVGVAYVLRHHPALAEMRAAIHGGRFGDPVQLTFQAGQCFPHYRPAYREIYYASHASGGGAIQDVLTHGMNMAQWMIGPMTRLVADAEHQVLDGVDVEDTVHVIGRHHDVMASYTLNQYQAPNEFTISVVCTGGTVRGSLQSGLWQWQSDPESTWNTEGCYPTERDDLFISQANRFLDSVDRRGAQVCTLDEGLQTLQSIQAVLRSSRNGAWESVE